MTDQTEPEAPAAPANKPARDWRGFLFEIGTIILGILIALAVNEIAEDVRWNQQVKEARAAIHEEMAFNNGFLQQRVRVEPCVARRLDQIEAALSAAEGSGRAAAVPGANVGLSAQISDAQWQTARAAQTLAHFPHEELAALGRYYDTINTFKTNFMVQEGDAWRWLGDLESGPHAVSHPELTQLRYQLRSARRLNTIIPRASRTMLDTAARLDVKPAKRDAAAWDKLCAETGG